MKVLVINAGSSSLKYQLIDMSNEKVISKGGCEKIGLKDSFLKHSTETIKDKIITKYMPTHKEALEDVLEALVSKEYGAISSMSDIDAVGHRVLHSSTDFTGSVVITDEVLKIIESNIDLGPLHMPANIMGIKACKEVMPKTPMVAVFDTAFHSTMPDYAALYAIPYKYFTEDKVKKYGFHGTSHKYVSQEAVKYLGKKESKIITCHLGNGSSISAVVNGKCVDTSMGFTPLEGVPMGTRSGDIDPAVLEYLMKRKGYSIEEMLTILNKKSGMLGVSEHGSDFRDLVEEAAAGNEKAALALNMFAYRVKKYIGSYIAAMNGLDLLVITAGIGENNKKVRELVLTGLDNLGIVFDKEKNEKAPRGEFCELSTDDSPIKIIVIPTNEELVIARETKTLVLNN